MDLLYSHTHLSLEGDKVKLFYKIKEIISSRRRITKSCHFDRDFSIISCNCIGGLIYHDYNLKFLSPTINLYIESPDFIKFVQNLSNYLSLELIEIFGYKYPVGKLGDIKIHFLHYDSFYDAKMKWDERKKRVNFSNIFVIMSDRDNYSDSLFSEFKKIKYKKILFSHKFIDDDEVVFVEKDRNKPMVDDLTKYIDFRGNKVYEYYFDFEEWLAGNKTAKECMKK